MSDRTQWDIALHPRFERAMEDTPITDEGEEAARNLLHVLRQCAGHLKEHRIGSHAVRFLRNDRTYFLPNGKILPPILLTFEMSEDGSTALVLGFFAQPGDRDKVVICGEEYEETVRQHALEDSEAWK